MVKVWLVGAGGGSQLDFAASNIQVPTKGSGVSADDESAARVRAAADKTIALIDVMRTMVMIPYALLVWFPLLLPAA
jgi:hypothetical protein